MGIIDSIKNKLSQWNKPTVYREVWDTPAPTITPTPTMVPEDKQTRAIRRFFEERDAPAATLAANFAKEAKKYPAFKNNPYLMPAIAQKETGGGKNINSKHPHNLLNWGIYEPTFQPKTPVEVIGKATSGIGKRSPYYEKFRKSGNVDDVIDVYAPPNENDTKLYKKQMREFMNEFKKYEQ